MAGPRIEAARRAGREYARDGRISDGTQAELDAAIRQIVAKAVVSDEVIDIFAAAGMKKPNIAILSDEFLAEVQGMPKDRMIIFAELHLTCGSNGIPPEIKIIPLWLSSL